MVLIWGCVYLSQARQAAPSSHFNFGRNVAGDIQVSEVRVPSDGIAPSTYYETLGFRGNKGNNTGNGYGGIQGSKDQRGNRVHIFSIWHSVDNPKDKANFPYVVHLGHGMKAEHFGGEGVGLKTWKLTSDKSDPLYWKPDVWHTHVVRCWPEGGHTMYAFFARDGGDGVWRHLSTIGVREANILMTGPNDTFIEDWEGTGALIRKIHIRNNWRRSNTGVWFPAQGGRFSVNFWDLDKGKRSYEYRTNWNAGIRKDKGGEFYFMEIGGDASPTKPLAYPNKLSSRFSIPIDGSKPNYRSGEILALHHEILKDGKLRLHWKINDSALPQFTYQIKLLDNKMNSIFSLKKIDPHIRQQVIHLEEVGKKDEHYTLEFLISDLFDNVSAIKKIKLKF